MGWFKDATLQSVKQGTASGEHWDDWSNEALSYRGYERYWALKTQVNPLKESQVLSRLGVYTGFDGQGSFVYGSSTYVQAPGGLNLPIARPYGTSTRQNSCGSFLEDQYVNLFLQFLGGVWSDLDHKQFVINTNPIEYFGPVEVMADVGYGADPQMITASTPLETIQPHTLCQGWNLPYTAGHTFLILRAYRGKLLILESNVRAASSQNGPGWWGIGDLSRYPTLEALGQWWERGGVPTLEDVLVQYPRLKGTALHVSVGA